MPASVDLSFLLSLLREHPEDAVACLASIVASEADPALRKGVLPASRPEGRRQQRRSLT